MDFEKIYKETKAELEQLNTEQAVRLEKIKTLAAEFGFEVDGSLQQNIETKRAELEKQRAEYEAELERLVSELEKTQDNG